MSGVRESEEERRERLRRQKMAQQERQMRNQSNARRSAASNTKERARSAARKRKMRRRRIRRTIFLMLLFLMIITAGALALIDFTNCKNRIKVEAGQQVLAEAFARRGGSASFVRGHDKYDTSVPGNYEVQVRVGLFTHTVTIEVVDTIAPKVKVQDLTVTTGQEADPLKFAKEINDATEVSAEFVEMPDMNGIGSYPVTIRFTDMGGNITLANANLLISPFISEMMVEAGSVIPTVEELAVANVAGTIVTPADKIEMNHVGDATLSIESEGINYECILHVQDTIAPVIRIKNLEAYFTAKLTGTEFIESVEDATDITATFDVAPDMSKGKKQKVTITFCDEGGNKVTESANLTLVEDKEAPRIACPDSYQINVGDSVLFAELAAVTDNCFDQYELKIDKGGIDVNTEGTYKVTFTATDAAGNESSRTMEIRVIIPKYSQETVDELADEVLAGITNASMSDREKAQAIYRWVQANVRYINHSEKSDWLKAAYEALHDHQGDCYGFAMVAKELLTRANIKNMDIEKIPAASMHYWNLVDVGDGWYHFDTCPRRNAHNFCLISDAELMQYSNANNKSHNYNPDNYPHIN